MQTSTRGDGMEVWSGSRLSRGLPLLLMLALAACSDADTVASVTVEIEPGVGAVYVYDGEIADDRLLGVVTSRGQVARATIGVPAGHDVVVLTAESPLRSRYASTATVTGRAELHVDGDFAFAWSLGGAPGGQSP